MKRFGFKTAVNNTIKAIKSGKQAFAISKDRFDANIKDCYCAHIDEIQEHKGWRGYCINGRIAIIWEISGDIMCYYSEDGAKKLIWLEEPAR